MFLSELDDHPAIRRIDIHAFERLFTPNLKFLTKIIEYYGFNVRIVGGFVRDVLMGKVPRDIDLLTDALPDQIIFILEKNGIHPYTKGIPHGTLKVKFPDEEFEITSMSFQIDDECCPHHLTVHSGRSWKDDAQRRDFTIDAMSLDFDGHLYDYLHGYHDLRSQTVKFIGDAAKQIERDPVVMLRFFRMLSLFPNPQFDNSLLPLIKEKAKLVKKIKPKRVDQELTNIRKGTSAKRILKLVRQLLGEYLGTADLSESNGIAAQLVPALKVIDYDGSYKIFLGRKGQTHADVFSRLDPEIADNARSVDGGFVDIRARKYLTRTEALIAIGHQPSNYRSQLQSEELRQAQA